MQITVEFLNEQKQHLENERLRALTFIANADGGLSMIAAMLERLAVEDKEKGPLREEQPLM